MRLLADTREIRTPKFVTELLFWLEGGTGGSGVIFHVNGVIDPSLFKLPTPERERGFQVPLHLFCDRQ